jgi:hypothetical protein
MPVDLYRFQCIIENLSHSELLSIENIRDFRGAILICNLLLMFTLMTFTEVCAWQFGFLTAAS